MPLKGSLFDIVVHVFSEAVQGISDEVPDGIIEITRATQKSFGHYQCNSAMRLSKMLKKSPREIGEMISVNLRKVDTYGLFDTIEVAGPGFINVTIKDTFIASYVKKILQAPDFFKEAIVAQRVVIDFSSPNVAKEMHVGHLRSTIIGDSLARVLEFLGHDVVRLNHIGDWGTSFGMLIAYLKRKELSIGTLHLGDLVRFYREAKKLFDLDPAFKKEAQLEVVLLQGGDSQSRAIWEDICTISRKAYKEIYDLLGITLEDRGESFYNFMLEEIVKDLEEKGLITVSDGAKCLFLDGFENRDKEPLPLIVQKSDGGYNYDTTDMAALHHRIFDEKAERIIIVTDAGQATHFKMIFAAGEKAGYVRDGKPRLDHVPFGLVQGADRKKFRTREGETERLIDLLETAIQKAEEIIQERNQDWSEEQKKKTAKTLGIGAVKYADLSCNRISDYLFSYEKMLRFDGNTAVFILYSYVRIASIKRKVGREAIDKEQDLILTHPSEVALGIKIAQFPEIIEQVAEDLFPNRITEYLYDLAGVFNAFFRDCRVEGAPEQNSRLVLIEACRVVMEKGLYLLGIETLDVM